MYESPYKTVEEWLDALEGDDLAEAKALLGVEGELDEQTRWPRETPVAEFHEGQVPLYDRTKPLTAEQFTAALRVEQALETLRTADREILERRWYEQLTLQAIADEDGSTYQAVQQRLDTATRRFQDALKGV